jgi:hypothetical protein
MRRASMATNADTKINNSRMSILIPKSINGCTCYIGSEVLLDQVISFPKTGFWSIAAVLIDEFLVT